MENNFKKTFIVILISSMIISSVFGSIMGFWAGSISQGNTFGAWIAENLFGQDSTSGQDSLFAGSKTVKVEEDSAVIDAVEKVSPTVVSIIITKDLPILERYYSEPFGGSDFFEQFFGGDISDFFGFQTPQYRQKGTEKQEIGGGTGFLVSADGYIVTNKHVVIDEEADYTVLLNDETRHGAEVLARDPLTDLAVLKINGNNLPSVEFGDSTTLKVGQRVIAIGNALGEFRNTVSTGVISGLARSVIAGGSGIGSEELLGVIQTDASINPGNSGGPLLNIAGQVVGINTAMAVGAENIGFAIPINEVKNTIVSVKQHGRIIRPWLGVRYIQINDVIAEENKLSVDFGALVVRGDEMTDLAVIPGSPADKAGLAENDIILELDGKKIDSENTLARTIAQYSPGDEVKLKVIHRGEEKEIAVKLEEMEN